MEAKDILNLSISALALLVAFGTTIYTAIRGNYEQKRVILGQLNDVLDHMSSIRVDSAKLFREYAAKNDVFYYQNVLSPELNQRYMTLLDQAMYLAGQESVKSLVTAPVLNTIAVANVAVGRNDLASEYYLNAIKATKGSAYYKALAMRSYAQFLFMQHRFEEGREQFNETLKLLTGGDNTVRNTRGYTYLAWASLERDMAHSEKRPQELFESARNEFNGIDVDSIRQQMLDYATAVENAAILPYKQDSQHLPPLQPVQNSATMPQGSNYQSFM